MSLTRDREPVEVRVWSKAGWNWIKVRRYIVHRNDGWLTYIRPHRGKCWAAPQDWRKVKRES